MMFEDPDAGGFRVGLGWGKCLDEPNMCLANNKLRLEHIFFKESQEQGFFASFDF